MYVGVIVFFIGVVCLAVYVVKARSSDVAGYWKLFIVVLVLLLVNFPVAAAIIGAVRYVISTSTVTVYNQSRIVIEDFLVSNEEHLYYIGSILPNEKIEKKFTFSQKGKFIITSHGVVQNMKVLCLVMLL